MDYVRMVRGQKGIDWSRYLEPADEHLLAERIEPDAWYPMAAFERLGLAILHEVARGDQEAVRMWGRFQLDAVQKFLPDLIAEGDPTDTLMRFGVLCRTLFDYEALVVASAGVGHAMIDIAYGMGVSAEETATNQCLGFFEALLGKAGAQNVTSQYAARAWRGAAKTRLELFWD